MSSDKKEYVKLRPLTQKHLKNLYNLQLDKNCSKVGENNETVTCNICGYETDLEFLGFGKSNRPNEKCPNCYSLKRTRLLWYYLENYTDYLKKDNVRILHTAPETSIYKKVKTSLEDNYISSDITPSQFVDEIIDIQDIPYEDNTFDLIMSSHVLEHVPNDMLALKEFYRVLKPNGMVILLVPSLSQLKKTFELPQLNTSNLRRRYYKQHDHRRYYSTSEFIKRLEFVGFKTKPEHLYFLEDNEEIKDKYSLADDPLFVAIKKEVNISESKVKNSYCNICDSNVEFEINKLNDKICPKCKSTSDERLLFGEYEKADKKSSVLYIQPSNALTNKLSIINTNYTTLPAMHKKRSIHNLFKRKNQNISDENITEQLKIFSDNTFDIIFSTYLLDKTVNYKELFKELKRVTKTGGKIILKENLDIELFSTIEEEYIDTPPLRKMFYGDGDSLRCYGLDLITYIENEGFTVEYENPAKQENNIKLKKRLVKNPLLVCTKKDL